jgi:hypothetical protein
VLLLKPTMRERVEIEKEIPSLKNIDKMNKRLDQGNDLNLNAGRTHLVRCII